MDSIRLKLSSLWMSVQHRPNAMTHWRIVDDHQRDAGGNPKKGVDAPPKTDSQKVKVEDASGKATPKASGKTLTPAKPGALKQRIPGRPALKPGKPKLATKDAKKDVKYAASMLGVKRAIDAEDAGRWFKLELKKS